jgi:hypothetical protein
MWGAIGKAINDTILRGKIKPLNKIVEDDSYDTYYNSMLTYVSAYGNNGGTIGIIPLGVTAVTEDNGFSGNSDVRTLVIPRTVTAIGSAAFRNCSSLISVIIPKSVTSISGGAFNGCASLESIYLPSSIKNITSVFSGCAALTDIYVEWEEGKVAGAPWGAPDAVVHYKAPDDE